MVIENKQLTLSNDQETAVPGASLDDTVGSFELSAFERLNDQLFVPVVTTVQKSTNLSIFLVEVFEFFGHLRCLQVLDLLVMLRAIQVIVECLHRLQRNTLIKLKNSVGAAFNLRLERVMH